MWIFTKFGMFSAVCKASDLDVVKVRARNPEDMERLQLFLDGHGIKTSEIVATPSRDYCCRFFLAKADWSKAMALIGDDMDYTNFKNAVHGDRDRDRAYMDVWSVMWNYQHRFTAN